MMSGTGRIIDKRPTCKYFFMPGEKRTFKFFYEAIDNKYTVTNIIN